MKIRFLRFLGPILWIVCTGPSALACRLVKAPIAAEMVARAEVILRTTAIDYLVFPGKNNGVELRTTGVPDSRIRFRVEAVLKGTYTAAELVLPGYLSDQDDWNDQWAPYAMVRRNGRSGSCFANTYRQGAQFLLVLKRTRSVPAVPSSNTEFTVNWYALGPVNEQLRSAQDPWLRWVRQQVKARRSAAQENVAADKPRVP